ncbi:MAG TPA: hypothetical protein VEH76_06410 [Methylocystis sp.]|nr:hypothetical protein [Methylocystis sp.]
MPTAMNRTKGLASEAVGNLMRGLGAVTRSDNMQVEGDTRGAEDETIS